MDECPDTYMVIDVPSTMVTLAHIHGCVKNKNPVPTASYPTHQKQNLPLYDTIETGY